MSEGIFTFRRFIDTEPIVETVIPGTGRTLKLRRWQILAFITGLVIVAAAITVVVVCSKQGSARKVGPNKVNPKIAACGISGKFAERIAGMSNNRLDPCEDFDLFACSQNAAETVGGNSTIMSSTFTELTETVLHVIKRLLEEPNANYEPRAVKMAKQMYYDCLFNSSFSSYYKNWSWLPFTNDSQFPIETRLAQIFAHNDQSIFGLDFTVDEDTSIILLSFSKGLPVQEIVAVTGDEQIVKFEKDLKKLWEESKCDEDKGDVWSERKNYGHFPLDYIQTKIPQIKWTNLVQQLFDILGLKEKVSSQTKVQFSCLKFFQGLGSLIDQTGSRNVFKYIGFRYVIENLVHLGPELYQHWVGSADLQEIENKLRHRRWKSCARIVKNGFGVAIAHLYQQKDPKTKTRKIVEEMTHYLKMAFRQVISKQAWIPARGKNQFQKKLIEKVEQMRVSYGYPEYIVNATMVDEYYHPLFLNQSSFMLNVLKAKMFLALKKFMWIHKKFDYGILETYVNPMEIGAFYAQQFNQIVLPVAMLHYPMFDEDYPMYLNFANLGIVVAHEMVHGFDNNGIRYDKNVNVSSWWPHDALVGFRNQATCFVEQYGKFKIPLIDTFVDGKITLGDNLSDNGGFPLSWMAYEMWAKDHNVTEPLLSRLNFTIPQIFYIAFSQVWCEIPSEFLSQAYTQDVHSPGKFRTLGVVQNSANFGKHFGCPAGSAMNPTHKCSLWS